MVGISGVKSASAVRNSPRIGSMNAVWEATSMLTRRAKRFCALTAAITASTGGHGAGDHRLARRDVARHTHFGVVGDQRLGCLGVELRAVATAPWPASLDINRERMAITRSPSTTLSAPATTAAVTSPIEWPITASGCTP